MNLRRGQPDALGDSAGILAPDVFRSEFDVEHGGMNVSVSHQVHQGRQGDASPHHVASEGVSTIPHAELPDYSASRLLPGNFFRALFSDS